MTDNEYYAQAKSQDDVKAASLMGLRLFERRTVSTRNLEILLWILYQLSYKGSPTATQSVQMIDRSTYRLHHLGYTFFSWKPVRFTLFCF